MNNVLEYWDGTADQVSVADGLFELAEKHIGPGPTTVTFTEDSVEVLVEADNSVYGVVYNCATRREVRGRLRHLGLSVVELATLHRVFNS